MATAIVSDLHLGTTSGADIARGGEPLARLAAELAQADRIVILGDLLELRERPVAEVLGLAGPFLDALGEAAAGKQVLIVPGNHDHELVAPALDGARLDGRPLLALENHFSPESGDLSRRVAARLPRSEVALAYPGVHLREDVYATHGHYLDTHLTVPRAECVIASAIARFAGTVREDGPPSPETYEAALAPMYAFAYRIVQGSSARAVSHGGSISRSVWSRSNHPGDSALASLALRRVAIPGIVGALNRLGLGPFRPDLSGVELRRAGLRAMAQVVALLGIEARHVVFGHTHRAGPLGGETEGWSLRGGTQLTNTGSWLYETVFLGPGDGPNPYFPGNVTLVGDHGPPRLANVLEGVEVSHVA